MDAQLKELIDTIKSEGVQEAEKQAKEILAAAEERGNEIIRNAEDRSSNIVEQARTQQKQSEQAGRAALVQAARDVILSVQAQLGSIFKDVVTDAVGQAMDTAPFEETPLAGESRVLATQPRDAGSGPGSSDGSAGESTPGDGGSTEEGGDSSGAVGGSGPGATGSDRVPDDIGDGSDDDIVARQLREAAMTEEDPELREKLWEEYRRYKESVGGSTKGSK